MNMQQEQTFLAHRDEQLDCLPQAMVTAALGSRGEHQDTCSPPGAAISHNTGYLWSKPFHPYV